LRERERERKERRKERKTRKKERKKESLRLSGSFAGLLDLTSRRKYLDSSAFGDLSASRECGKYCCRAGIGEGLVSSHCLPVGS
jgi:hypothetical protein